VGTGGAITLLQRLKFGYLTLGDNEGMVN